jgi:hypothetical protein
MALPNAGAASAFAGFAFDMAAAAVAMAPMPSLT